MRASPLTFTRKQWEPLAFASPALVLIALVILFPLAYSFYLSFQNFDLSVGPEREFVGSRTTQRRSSGTSDSWPRSGTPP